MMCNEGYFMKSIIWEVLYVMGSHTVSKAALITQISNSEKDIWDGDSTLGYDTKHT